MKTRNFSQTVIARLSMIGVLCIVAAVAVVTGCSTAKSVTKEEGKGTRYVFRSPYRTVWTASQGAVFINDLRVLDLNGQTGFILAKHDIGMTTFGVNVAVWVRPIATNVTSVEVVSRNAGPPFWPGWDLEKPILDDIATMLDQ